MRYYCEEIYYASLKVVCLFYKRNIYFNNLELQIKIKNMKDY